MARVLAYVDAPLTRQMATGLIGSEVKLTEREGKTAGINFKILLTRSTEDERSTTTKISDLLPEVVADAVYESTINRIDNLEIAREKLIAGSANAFKPGVPIVITNASISTDGKDQNALLSGEGCILYRLRIGEFFVHAYCGKDAENEFDSFASQPVEVLGLLRYTPSYPVPGAMHLSLGVRVCAVWLR